MACIACRTLHIAFLSNYQTPYHKPHDEPV